MWVQPPSVCLRSGATSPRKSFSSSATRSVPTWRNGSSSGSDPSLRRWQKALQADRADVLDPRPAASRTCPCFNAAWCSTRAATGTDLAAMLFSASFSRGRCASKVAARTERALEHLLARVATLVSSLAPIQIAALNYVAGLSRCKRCHPRCPGQPEGRPRPIDSGMPLGTAELAGGARCRFDRTAHGVWASCRNNCTMRRAANWPL